MLCITGGQWRGRKLRMPKSFQVRPTATKVRQAIFNIIESLRLKQGMAQSLEDCRCVDLCAGSGAMGLEALSRGAKSALFVEKAKISVDIITQNVATLKCEDRAKIMRIDVIQRAKQWKSSGPFDLIFLDPPYKDLSKFELEDLLGKSEVAVAGSILVIEHGPDQTPSQLSGWELNSNRVLGPAAISVFLRQ